MTARRIAAASRAPAPPAPVVSPLEARGQTVS